MKRTEFLKVAGLGTLALTVGLPSVGKSKFKHQVGDQHWGTTGAWKPGYGPYPSARFSTKQIDWLRIICNHRPFNLFITDDRIAVRIDKINNWDEHRLIDRIRPLNIKDEDNSISKYIEGSKYFWFIVEFISKPEKDDVINRICYNTPGGIKANTTLPPPYWMPRLDTADGYRYNNGATNITKHTYSDWSEMEAVAADVAKGIYA